MNATYTITNTPILSGHTMFRAVSDAVERDSAKTEVYHAVESHYLSEVYDMFMSLRTTQDKKKMRERPHLNQIKVTMSRNSMTFETEGSCSLTYIKHTIPCEGVVLADMFDTTHPCVATIWLNIGDFHELLPATKGSLTSLFVDMNRPATRFGTGIQVFFATEYTGGTAFTAKCPIPALLEAPFKSETDLEFKPEAHEQARRNFEGGGAWHHLNRHHYEDTSTRLSSTTLLTADMLPVLKQLLGFCPEETRKQLHGVIIEGAKTAAEKREAQMDYPCLDAPLHLSAMNAHTIGRFSLSPARVPFTNPETNPEGSHKTNPDTNQIHTQMYAGPEGLIPYQDCKAMVHLFTLVQKRATKDKEAYAMQHNRNHGAISGVISLDYHEYPTIIGQKIQLLWRDKKVPNHSIRMVITLTHKTSLVDYRRVMPQGLEPMLRTQPEDLDMVELVPLPKLARGKLGRITFFEAGDKVNTHMYRTETDKKGKLGIEYAGKAPWGGMVHFPERIVTHMQGVKLPQPLERYVPSFNALELSTVYDFLGHTVIYSNNSDRNSRGGGAWAGCVAATAGVKQIVIMPVRAMPKENPDLW